MLQLGFFFILLAMRNPTKTVNFELYFDEGLAGMAQKKENTLLSCRYILQKLGISFFFNKKREIISNAAACAFDTKTSNLLIQIQIPFKQKELDQKIVGSTDNNI